MIVVSLFPLLKKVPLRSELFVLGTRVSFRGFPTNANGRDIRWKRTEFCKIRSVEHFFLLVILISNSNIDNYVGTVAYAPAAQPYLNNTYSSYADTLLCRAGFHSKV